MFRDFSHINLILSLAVNRRTVSPGAWTVSSSHACMLFVVYTRHTTCLDQLRTCVYCEYTEFWRRAVLPVPNSFKCSALLARLRACKVTLPYKNNIMVLQAKKRKRRHARTVD